MVVLIYFVKFQANDVKSQLIFWKLDDVIVATFSMRGDGRMSLQWNLL